MKNQCYIVTEGQSDRGFLERLLPDIARTHSLTFMVSTGGNAALSTARSIAAVKAAPVALVVDADTTNEERVAERRAFLEEALGSAAAAAPWRVFLCVPEIEIVLFDAPEVLEQFFGTKFNELELELARAQPKRELNKLCANRQIEGLSQLLEELPPKSIRALQKTPLARQLKEFIEQAIAQPA